MYRLIEVVCYKELCEPRCAADVGRKDFLSLALVRTLLIEKYCGHWPGAVAGFSG